MMIRVWRALSLIGKTKKNHMVIPLIVSKPGLIARNKKWDITGLEIFFWFPNQKTIKQLTSRLLPIV